MEKEANIQPQINLVLTSFIVGFLGLLPIVFHQVLKFESRPEVYFTWCFELFLILIIQVFLSILYSILNVSPDYIHPINYSLYSGVSGASFVFAYESLKHQLWLGVILSSLFIIFYFIAWDNYAEKNKYYKAVITLAIIAGFLSQLGII